MIGSRSSPGGLSPNASAAGRGCGSVRSNTREARSTSAALSAEPSVHAVQYLTASSASVAESNARSKATRGKSRRGFTALGSVPPRQGQSRPLRPVFTWISLTGSMDGPSNTSSTEIACAADLRSVARRQARDDRVLFALPTHQGKPIVLSAENQDRTAVGDAAIVGPYERRSCTDSTETTGRDVGSMESHTTHQ